MNDEIPEQGESHVNSCHEVSLESILKRRENLCKHSVYTLFPKGQITRSVRGLKLQGSRAGDVMRESYLVLKFLAT